MLQTTELRSLSYIAIPPLENGDRLSREEFERRYEAMLDACSKVELIEGRVYMAAAALRDRKSVV